MMTGKAPKTDEEIHRRIVKWLIVVNLILFGVVFLLTLGLSF